MEKRLYLKLNMKEYRALATMAQAELREDRDQLRYLLRQEAQKRGLLPGEESYHKEAQPC